MQQQDDKEVKRDEKGAVEQKPGDGKNDPGGSGSGRGLGRGGGKGRRDGTGGGMGRGGGGKGGRRNRS